MSYVELYNNTFRNLLDWRLVEGGGEGRPGAAATNDNMMSSDPGSAFRAARADGRIEVCTRGESIGEMRDIKADRIVSW
jgi:hypothetical protein